MNKSIKFTYLSLIRYDIFFSVVILCNLEFDEHIFIQLSDCHIETFVLFTNTLLMNTLISSDCDVGNTLHVFHSFIACHLYVHRLDECGQVIIEYLIWWLGELVLLLKDIPIEYLCTFIRDAYRFIDEWLKLCLCIWKCWKKNCNRNKEKWVVVV